MYNNRRVERSTDNGIIYPIVIGVMNILFYLNIVEWIKKLSNTITKKVYSGRSHDIILIKIRQNRNFAIDFFIILKFIFVLMIFFLDYKNAWVFWIVIYLLCSNLYTYFYYHLWEETALLEEHQTVHRVRRRFISLFISFIFMMVCYNYIYLYLSPEHFNISSSNHHQKIIMFSLAKSFVIDNDLAKSQDLTGLWVEISQLINVFTFITILLAKSMPKANTR
ncbi:hypothetical protein [Heyndrickxia camelliae]|uniref:Uncharacterized protein n=1 Tax=Heyndrickxia camelliae TaxID=1707093 RepID=A0A2N3LD06_9BACI|nr:hypothetical protein [Heyndrickxia camelliae]PKR82404.1 hypothetical protein CWO92_24620 [Heyndrickxia camelliae]